MEKRRFGKTELELSLVGIGSIPFIYIAQAEVNRIISKGIDCGVNFIETSRHYRTSAEEKIGSEEKIGKAIKGKRNNIILITKAHTFSKNIDESLKALGTDYIDVYQIHGIKKEKLNKLKQSGEIEHLVKARKEGKIRFIGVTSHYPEPLLESMEEDLFTSIQAPINFIEYERYEKVVEVAKAKDFGILAMKPLGGGLFPAKESLRYLKFTPVSAIPIGINKESEIIENVKIVSEESTFSEEENRTLKEELKKWGDKFCRKCGYCGPCPQGISIPDAMVTEIVCIRDGLEGAVNFGWIDILKSVDKCERCRKCVKKCPYHLKIPETIHAYRDKYLPLLEDYLKKKR